MTEQATKPEPDHAGAVDYNKPPLSSDGDLARRLAAACAAGELTTPASREVCELALRVCELELENAALRGQLDARQAGSAQGAQPDLLCLDWDHYLLWIAEMVSVKSPDPATKHGCVLADAQHRLIATGYNGPVQGVDDTAVPLTRPAKYNWLIHAEANAILFAHGELRGATAYVTGYPCAACFRMLLQAGVTRIVHGPRYSQCVSSEERAACATMASQLHVVVEEISLKPEP